METIQVYNDSKEDLKTIAKEIGTSQDYAVIEYLIDFYNENKGKR